MSAFEQQVFDAIGRIPRGQVAAYGQIARLVGKPRGARAVGWAMKRCPRELPWWRLLRSDGSLSPGCDPGMQRWLLEAEGVHFLADGRVDMGLHAMKEEFWYEIQ